MSCIEASQLCARFEWQAQHMLSPTSYIDLVHALHCEVCSSAQSI